MREIAVFARITSARIVDAAAKLKTGINWQRFALAAEPVRNQRLFSVFRFLLSH